MGSNEVAIGSLVAAVFSEAADTIVIFCVVVLLITERAEAAVVVKERAGNTLLAGNVEL